MDSRRFTEELRTNAKIREAAAQSPNRSEYLARHNMRDVVGEMTEWLTNCDAAKIMDSASGDNLIDATTEEALLREAIDALGLGEFPWSVAEDNAAIEAAAASAVARAKHSTPK